MHLKLLPEESERWSCMGRTQLYKRFATSRTADQRGTGSRAPSLEPNWTKWSGLANILQKFLVRQVLRVTRTRVPYVASTTLVPRYVVNSNATPFIPSHLSSLLKDSNQTGLTA
jgi:hypothetical protein